MPVVLIATLALFSSMATCVDDRAPTTPEAIVRARAAPEAIVHAATGREVSFEEMLADLFAARAIYVAERHDSGLDHAAQYAIFRALHADSPNMVLAMEMFQTPYQEALDRWVEGRLDETALLEATEYRRRWGFDIGYYRPLLELARAYHVPVRALTAPSELSRKVAAGGLDGLDDAERQALPELDLAVPGHRALVEAELREHPDMSDAKVERFYQAQVLWDETMAEGVAAALGASPAPARVQVLAGRLHVMRGLGVPARARRRGVDAQRIVIPIDASELDEALEAPPDARWGDYLWVHAE